MNAQSAAAITSGPLNGAGILITRPARQAEGLAARVAAIGGRPVVFPAIVILPPADPAALARVQARLSDYDYAVLVSANAVEYGAPDRRRWPERLIAFAPGPGTAEALAAVGIGPVRLPDSRYDSAGLLALPELADPRGRRILIFRGDEGREELGEGLRRRGAHVDYVACYRRAKPSSAAGLDAAFAEGRVDAVTLTSSEGLDNLWALLAAASRTHWRALPSFVPHARIAARAHALGLRAIETEAGDAGLIAGLLAWHAAAPGKPL